MNAPQVQYVTTCDGYDIAYTVMGRGTPLVLTPPAFHHLQMAWQWPSRRALLEGLSQRFRLILFDPRGQGMSTRSLPETFTPADYRLDLETVIDHVGLDHFILASTCLIGHEALRYAADNAERVEALILFATAVSNCAWPLRQFASVGRENWDLLLWSRLAPSVSAAWEASDLVQTGAIIHQADAITRWEACAESDISAVARNLHTPTLVIHPRGFLHLGPDEAIRLAAAIPNAHLALIDSDDPGDLHGRPEQALAAIDAFLEDLRPTTAGPDGLSVRQREVLQLIARGRTNREIAADLTLSLRTVERHVEDLYRKLNLRNRAEATAFALGQLTPAK